MTLAGQTSLTVVVRKINFKHSSLCILGFQHFGAKKAHDKNILVANVLAEY